MNRRTHTLMLRVARAEALRWWRLGQSGEVNPEFCHTQRTLWRARAAEALGRLRGVE